MSGLCVFVKNLKPRKMIDFKSEGMMLFANDSKKFELIRPNKLTKPGTRITRDGCKAIDVLKEETKVKSKYLEACFPHLKTDMESFAIWKG